MRNIYYDHAERLYTNERATKRNSLVKQTKKGSPFQITPELQKMEGDETNVIEDMDDIGGASCT